MLRDADGDGHPVFGNPTISTYPSERGVNAKTSSMAFGDLNGNGALDLVVTNVTQATGPSAVWAVTVLLNKGDGVFYHGETYDVSPRAARGPGGFRRRSLP